MAGKTRSALVAPLKCQVVHFIMQHWPSIRSGPDNSLVEAMEAEQRVLDGALSLIQKHEGEFTPVQRRELIEAVYRQRDREVNKRDAERLYLARLRVRVATRREYREQMKQAKDRPDEKKRLQEERRVYVRRLWYQQHRAEEQAKSRVRNRLRRQYERKCCPFKMLGAAPIPDRGVVKLWVTRCLTCQRKEWGWLGDRGDKMGLHFRGIWFEDIDPETGIGTTLEGERILLTRVD